MLTFYKCVFHSSNYVPLFTDYRLCEPIWTMICHFWIIHDGRLILVFEHMIASGVIVSSWTMTLVVVSIVTTMAIEDDWVKLPTKCESCRLFVTEFEAKFRETGRSHEVIRTQKGIVGKYATSEIRLIETLENICDRMLDYRMHKEFDDVRRFAKGTSRTMRTLSDLQKKGVKVDLGMPDELWDAPSAEITRLKLDCESIVDTYEEDLEVWFANEQQTPLIDYLCAQRVLTKDDSSACLTVDNSRIEL